MYDLTQLRTVRFSGSEMITRQIAACTEMSISPWMRAMMWRGSRGVRNLRFGRGIPRLWSSEPNWNPKYLLVLLPRVDRSGRSIKSVHENNPILPATVIKSESTYTVTASYLCLNR